MAAAKIQGAAFYQVRKELQITKNPGLDVRGFFEFIIRGYFLAFIVSEIFFSHLITHDIPE